MFVINQLYLAFAPGATWKKTMAYFIREHTIAPRLDYLQHIFIFIERDREKLTVFALYKIEWGTKKKKKNYYKTSE